MLKEGNNYFEIIKMALWKRLMAKL